MDENTEQELLEMEKALTSPEEADNTTESKEEEAKTEEVEATDDTEETEETTEEPEDEDDEEAPRNPKVPYKKFKIEREKRKELESTLSELKADIEAIKNQGNKKDDIEKLAEEYGVDPAFAKKLADNIKGSIKSPISDEEIELLRETKIEREQDAKFESEFKELLEVNPDAKEHKKKLREMAFDPKYSGKNFKPLYYIYGKEVQANKSPKTKTAETSSPKKTDNSVVDYENLSEADAMKTLSPDKFLEWVEYQSKK